MKKIILALLITAGLQASAYGTKEDCAVKAYLFKNATTMSSQAERRGDFYHALMWHKRAKFHINFGINNCKITKAQKSNLTHIIKVIDADIAKTEQNLKDSDAKTIKYRERQAYKG